MSEGYRKRMKHFSFFSAILNPMRIDNQTPRNMNFSTKIGLYFLLSFFLKSHAFGNPPLRIVGSSAVFPFAATVAEHFSYKTHEPIPLIEAIGTGAGIKLFCGNIHGPDGVITSRSFTKKEKEKCTQNGITYEEFIIGQDGLVLIQNKKNDPFSLTINDLNQALSKKILREKKCLINPSKVWKDIQKTFPSTPIRILGPAPNSGSYDILVEKIGGACGPFIRHDGVYIEAAANENLIIQKVLNSLQSIGIITFSYYDQNKARLQALPINDVLPSFKSIQAKQYPLSRPLYFYVKINDLKSSPSRQSYTREFTSPQALGEKGYLRKKGLIPLSPDEQHEMYNRALNLREKGDS
jgi:phosphate transport system substrate-binding protein